MTSPLLRAVIPAAVLGALLRAAAAGDAAAPAHVDAPTPVAAGRYLVQAAGCNDCHTSGWAQSNGTLPERRWLTGSAIGSRGPWGTAYPPNLRILAAAIPEDAWVQMFRGGDGPGPMPWWNYSHGKMSDRDLRAIHAFIRGLGPAGRAAPADVAPNVEPKTPYTWAVPPPGRH